MCDSVGGKLGRLPFKNISGVIRFIPLLMHGLAVVLLILSGFLWLEAQARRELTVVWDVSRSIRTPDFSQLTPCINKLQPTSLTVIAAAANARIVHEGEELRGIPDISKLDRSQSNLQKALQLARNKYSDLYARRRVLIASDGYQTIGDAASYIKKNGLHVDCIATGSRPEIDGRVLWLRLPSEVHGEFNARAFFKSEQNTSAIVGIKDNSGKIITSRSIDLDGVGKVIEFKIPALAPGVRRLTAFIELAGDEIYQNNESSSLCIVKKQAPLLWCGKLPPAPAFKYTLITPDEITTEILQESPALVISGISKRRVIHKFEIINEYINNGGNMLIIADRQTSSWAGSKLEKVSPVSLTPDNNLAVVFALDTSGSMSEKSGKHTKLSIAKNALLAALAKLAPSDKAALITFSASATIAQPLRKSPAIKNTAQALASVIPAGGTSIFPPITLATQILKNVQAKHKYLIIITDGQTREKDHELKSKISAAVKMLTRAKVQTSIITVDSTAQLDIMRQLAGDTENVLNASAKLITLPAILQSEIIKARISTTLPPQNIHTPQASITINNAIETGSLRNQDAGKVIIKSSQGNIILSSRQIGAGRSMLLSAAPWTGWQPQTAGMKILEQITENITKPNTTQISAYSSGGLAYISFKPQNKGDTRWQCKIFKSGKQIKTIPLTRLYGGVYSAKTPLEQSGEYMLNVQNLSKPATPAATVSLLVNDNLEYLNFGADGNKLSVIAKYGGGELALSPGNLRDWTKIPPSGRRPVSSYLLPILALISICCGLITQGLLLD